MDPLETQSPEKRLQFYREFNEQYKCAALFSRVLLPIDYKDWFLYQANIEDSFAHEVFQLLTVKIGEDIAEVQMRQNALVEIQQYLETFGKK